MEGTLVEYKPKRPRSDNLRVFRYNLSTGQDKAAAKGYGQRTGTIYAKDRKAAELQLIEIWKRLKGNWSDPSAITVGQLFDKWMEEHVRPGSKKKTIDDYESIGRLHLDSIRDKPLDKIRGFDLNKIYRAAGSPTVAAKVHRTLRAMFNCAEKWRIITHDNNPAYEADPPKVDLVDQPVLSGQGIIKFLTEVIAFRNSASRGPAHCEYAEYFNKQKTYCIFLMALSTGARRGEIFGLRKQDINLETGDVFIRQKLTAPGLKPIFEPVKSKKSFRRVLATPALLNEFQYLFGLQEEIREQAREWADYDLVFPNQNGRPMDPNHFSDRVYKPLLEKAGLPVMKFHCLRHTFITILAEQGYVQLAKEMAGHADIRTTQGYTHLSTKAQLPAVELFQQMINPR